MRVCVSSVALYSGIVLMTLLNHLQLSNFTKKLKTQFLNQCLDTVCIYDGNNNCLIFSLTAVYVTVFSCESVILSVGS